MRFVTIAYRTVRALLVLAAGVATLLYLVRTKPKPESVSRADLGPLVKTTQARAAAEKFTVSAQGTVSPKRAAAIVAEVGGRIVERSARLEEGARFEKGDLLLQIDPEDLRLQVQQLQGQLEQAKAEIAQLEAERRNTEALRSIAAREAQLALKEHERAQSLLAKGTIAQEEADKRERSYLQSRTLYQNQENALRLWPERVRLLKAKQTVTEAALKEAQRNLERTEVRAPFSGRIEKVSAEVGEYVQPGAQLARVWDDSAVEVRVNLRPEEVRWIVPTTSTAQVQSWISGGLELEGEVPDWIPRAKVSYKVGERQYTWPGFVRGFEGTVEQQTRTVPVLIEVRDPWKSTVPGEQPPLVPGMYSQVVIEGREVEGLFELPRSALQLDGTVWVARDGKLEKRSVQTVRTVGQTAYVTGGRSGLGAMESEPLQAGDHVVVTQMAAPVEGMPVRLENGSGSVVERTTASL